uniref:Uncharacterized protein n=1 Tax=Acrobeloides nanus TaxID=290746 RepID=A0A914DQ49_9BILA
MKDGPFHETAYTILPDLEVLAFPINLTHVETPTQQLGSFLSIGWGMMADIDTESEKWRFMGNLRLFFGAVVRLIDFRTYRGRLSYLRSEPSEAKTIEPTKVYGTNVSSSTSAKSSTVKNEEDLTEFFEAHHGSDYGRIPRLNEEIPENWETIEDEFLLVYAMSLSHISNNGDYVHQASLVDDQIYLTYILKNDVDSRINVTKFLLAVEGYFGRSGHQQFDFFRVI